MAGLRINTTASVDKSVYSESYPRINCRASGANPRINCRAFTHNLSRLLIYLYVPVLKTCSWRRLPVENLAGLRTSGLLSNEGPVLVASSSGNPFF
jgi:hypothetical protein